MSKFPTKLVLRSFALVDSAPQYQEPAFLEKCVAIFEYDIHFTQPGEFGNNESGVFLRHLKKLNGLSKSGGQNRK